VPCAEIIIVCNVDAMEYALFVIRRLTEETMDGRAEHVSSGYAIHVAIQSGIEIVKNVEAIMNTKN